MSDNQQITIEQAINLAEHEVELGHYPNALQLYKAVLQQEPTHQAAETGLQRLLQLISGEQTAGATPPPEPASPDPADIDQLINLFHSGQLAATEQACRALLQHYPQAREVFNILGVTLQTGNRLSEAIEIYDQAIALQPDYAEAYSNRGSALLAQGAYQQALASFDRALELNPSLANAYYSRANCLQALGQLEQALESYDHAIQLAPDASAFCNHRVVLKTLGRYWEAVESFQHAIQINPELAIAYYNCGSTLKALDQLEEAVHYFDQAIALQPGDAATYNNRGNTLRNQGLFKEALESYRQAIALQPGYTDARYNFGVTYQMMGELETAREHYEAVIEQQPDYVEAHRSLSTLKRYQADDPQIEQMEVLYQAMEATAPARIHLCFALAKAHEDLDQVESSFGYLEEGNRLRKEQLGYRFEDDRRMVEKIMALFSHESSLPSPPPLPGSPLQPLFVVGMMRSGTSLVEQILSSHSSVHGAGELNTLHRLVRPMLSQRPEADSSEEIPPLSVEEINTLQRSYLDALAALKVTESTISDKMPLNFLWIGFILSAFPEVKIVHLERDPVATCWSIYKHYFSADGNGYAYDLQDLARFYKLYRKLMAFWQQRFPGRIYDLCYESLTEHQEEETRKLLAYCGLEWEEACLEFHKSRRAVKTASALQVRNKMYTGSSQAWRRFEPHLAPLIEALERDESDIDEQTSATVPPHPSQPTQEAVDRVVQHYHAGALPRCEAECRALLEEHPHSLVLHNILGITLQEQGRQEEAITSYDRITELEPNHIDAYYNRGNALKGLGRLYEASMNYSQATQLKPDFPEAYYNRALVLTQLGQQQEALEQYRLAIHYRPDFADAYCSQGDLLSEWGAYEEAIECYDQALQLNLALVEAYNNRGLALHHLNRSHEAIESFNHAIQHHPESVEAYGNRGDVESDIGALQAALISYDHALQIDPTQAGLYHNRGCAYQKLGMLEEALADFNRTIELDPQFATAYSNRGIVEVDLERVDLALEDMQHALTLAPKNSQISDALIDLLNFYPPQQTPLIPYGTIQSQLQQIPLDCSATTEIPHQTVQQLYGQCEQILSQHPNELQSDLTQLYRGAKVDLGCLRHKLVFNTYQIIPRYCFDCYKVIPQPRSVMELFKLALLFGTLSLPNDNSRKCMVECRTEVSGSYKGFIYCRSLQEARAVQTTVEQAIASTISEDLPVVVKRGCSEFQAASAEYGRIPEDPAELMPYPQAWQTIEEQVFERLSPHFNPNQFTHNHNRMTLRDAIVMSNWLRYAALIGDPSQHEISDRLTPLLSAGMEQMIRSRPPFKL